MGLQSFAIRLASCLALAAPVACGRGSRAEGTVPVAPTEAAHAEAPELGGTEPLPQDATAALARAQARQAFVLVHGDAAEQARARFTLAEAYADAAAQLDLVRFDLQAERSTGSPSAHPELARREAELDAQQQAWLDAAALEYAEVLRATDPVALELRARAWYGVADVERRRGDPAAMHDALVALVHDTPTHPLASTALLALADEAFAANRLEQARALYEQVLVLGGDEQHYARYKLGWVAFGLDDAAAALAHWTAVATVARSVPQLHALAEKRREGLRERVREGGAPREGAGILQPHRSEAGRSTGAATGRDL